MGAGGGAWSWLGHSQRNRSSCRCKCNGHASECAPDDAGQLVCVCQHNTAGADCERCQPFYQDRPWARGTAEAANECLPCNCSGRSEECFYDRELYRRSGHGGHCRNCRDNTAGPHCERCRQNHYRWEERAACQPCHCHPAGSLQPQCDSSGTCLCKANVTGWKCERCKDGYHSLSEGGCRPCACDPAGSVGICDPNTGHCTCKERVEGHLCNRCQPGWFNLQPQNPAGCTSCFCYGHSTACTAADGYEVTHVRSDFSQGLEGWAATAPGTKDLPLHWTDGEIVTEWDGEEPVDFLAPGKRCELCDDGFFGDPLGQRGPVHPCVPCQCHGNVDLNAVGNCDPVSGRCLRCLYNTTGEHCEKCRPGFYGDALAPDPAGKCARTHEDAMVQVEAVVGRALRASSASSQLLQSLLEGNETRDVQHELEAGYEEIQRAREELGAGLAEVAVEARRAFSAVEKANADMAEKLLQVAAVGQHELPVKAEALAQDLAALEQAAEAQEPLAQQAVKTSHALAAGLRLELQKTHGFEQVIAVGMLGASLSCFLPRAQQGDLEPSVVAEAVLSAGRLQLERLGLRLATPGALAGQLSLLQQEAARQQEKIQAFESDLAEIRADKQNLEDILRSLPEGCSK
ncbi:laminin subunit gamma-3 [Limosa lapponica baueri]|uniref:Laminin subunit gamma-3 n=1 Tax=Limosa lapponica baueri TaxID=1758121 RepID=A0A2I0TRI8_LIMLA|nr:laminin subunit gamma-3 [Limosa lapponica baueri]